MRINQTVFTTDNNLVQRSNTHSRGLFGTCKTRSISRAIKSLYSFVTAVGGRMGRLLTPNEISHWISCSAGEKMARQPSWMGLFRHPKCIFNAFLCIQASRRSNCSWKCSLKPAFLLVRLVDVPFCAVKCYKNVYEFRQLYKMVTKWACSKETVDELQIMRPTSCYQSDILATKTSIFELWSRICVFPYRTHFTSNTKCRYFSVTDTEKHNKTHITYSGLCALNQIK